MYTLYKFHFLNGISEINKLFDDIDIWDFIYKCHVCDFFSPCKLLIVISHVTGNFSRFPAADI